MTRTATPTCTLLLAGVSLVASPLPTTGARQTGPPVGAIDEGAPYTITRFVPNYVWQHPNLPPLAEVESLEMPMGRSKTGYVAPGLGEENVVLRLQGVPGQQLQLFCPSALRAINQQIVAYFNRLGLIGVYVAPDGRDLDARTGRDRRRGRTGPLRINIWAAVVKDIRTVAASGGSPGKKIDNPRHARIREGSLVKPFEPVERNDLIRKDLLDKYIRRLNRHPRRRVDVAVAPAGKPGEVALDYLISEEKPWMLYAQASNTGTRQTRKWRETLGFSHYQLTNRDDILSVNYVTAGGDKANAVVASYEFPIFSDRLRLKPYFSWSEFAADEVGFSEAVFTGESWTAGLELKGTVLQRKELFIDAVGGLRWQEIGVNNKLIELEGETNFLFPYVGMRLERRTRTCSTLGSLNFELSWPEAGCTDPEQLPFLGRLDPDANWQTLSWDFSHSAFIEPAIFGGARKDATAAANSTLAHEIYVSLKGQYALGDKRLIPQAQGVVGGFHSVRGYGESAAAGDTTIVANAEYRFHLPRALKPRPAGKEPRRLFGRPFHLARPSARRLPDWDLILRGFCDVGRAMVSDKLEVERDETLMSAGAGIELQFMRNLTFRMDWGYVLEGIGEGSAKETRPGDSRLHLMMSVLW